MSKKGFNTEDLKIIERLLAVPKECISLNQFAGLSDEL